MQSAPPTTTLAGTTTSGKINDATTVPTIVYDDSAVAEFWEPVPEGMTPAEFQPDVLTREEVTKYVELPNPNPDDWNIPEEGITPEYIERVYNYLLNLHVGLIRTGVAIGAANPRTRNSALAMYRGSMVDGFLERLDAASSWSEGDGGNWANPTRPTIVEFETRTVTAEEYPCVFARLRYDEVSLSGTTPQDVWIAIVRDRTPNWLNPTGWRPDTVADGQTADLTSCSCDSWDSDQGAP